MCKTKWKSLRESFRKAMNARKTKSGQSAKKIKPWRLESQMEFVKPYIVSGNEEQISNIAPIPLSGQPLLHQPTSEDSSTPGPSVLLEIGNDDTGDNYLDLSTGSVDSSYPSAFSQLWSIISGTIGKTKDHKKECLIWNNGCWNSAPLCEFKNGCFICTSTNPWGPLKKGFSKHRGNSSYPPTQRTN